jgi:cytochrome c
MTFRPTHVLIAAFAIFGGIVILSAQSAAPAGADRTIWDGVYTQAQSERGEKAYSDACASCHAAELTGGDVIPSLVGEAFLTNWSGMTVGDLFERIRTTMPQESPGSLTREQYADVLAHVFKKNKFPAGETELGIEYDALATIRIESKKPSR